MRKKKRLIMRSVILAIMLAAVTYTLYANFTKDRGQIAIGDEAPDFVLTDMEGKKHKLSDYRGKGVFLNFWATWCKPCEREMPYMNNQYKVFQEQGVEILAVNIGEPVFLINKFVEKHELIFPILHDKNKDVMRTYNIGPLPTTMLIDKDGIITAIETGELPEAKIKGMMESIKP